MKEIMHGGSPHKPRPLEADTEELHPVQDSLRLYSGCPGQQSEKTKE